MLGCPASLILRCTHGLDFQALETMMAGEEEDVSNGMDYPPVHVLNGNSAQTQGRFSRYLRFARRRRNQRDGRGEMQEHDHANDPTHEHTDSSSTSSPHNSV